MAELTNSLERQDANWRHPCSALLPGHRHCRHGHTEDCPDPGECELLPEPSNTGERDG
jgi:hypothetical protein